MCEISSCIDFWSIFPLDFTLEVNLLEKQKKKRKKYNKTIERQQQQKTTYTQFADKMHAINTYSKVSFSLCYNHLFILQHLEVKVLVYKRTF